MHEPTLEACAEDARELCHAYLEETWAEDLKKIAVFVPVTHAEAVRKAMCDAGAGEIGNYTCCTFAAPGESTFLPMEGSNPFLGEQGKLERVEEVRLEASGACISGGKCHRRYEGSPSLRRSGL